MIDIGNRLLMLIRRFSTLCKQRAEAIELCRKGGKAELAEKKDAELKVLQRLLPPPLSEDEVRDLGKIMKQLMYSLKNPMKCLTVLDLLITGGSRVAGSNFKAKWLLPRAARG